MKEALLLFWLATGVYAQSDGPAELPHSIPETRVSFTSKHSKLVGPNQDLIEAIHSAAPGETITVDPANVTKLTGLKQLGNDGQCPDKWLTIKSASALFADDDTRVNPSLAPQMPKIIIATQSASLSLAPCTRIIGFEITRTQGTGIVYNLIRQLTHDIIIDRSYIHGTPTDETTRGIMLSDSHGVAVINSYLSDFHCRAKSGSCTDAQAIAGGLDAVGGGVYLIRNNYLEASGESIVFGGGASVDVPSDITIQYNDSVKPMTWNPLDPSFNGGTAGNDGIKYPWVVKNHFELKNANRVLFEGNRMQNVWGGFSQVGAMILLTPKNQGGANPGGLCPGCAVTNVTVRYNWMSNEAQVFQLGNARGGGWSRGGGNWSIHDNLADGLQYATCYMCGSFANSIGSQYDATNPPPNALHDVSVVHNTFLLAKNGVWLSPPAAPAASAASAVLLASSPPPGTIPMSGIHFDYNSFDAGNYGVFNSGGGKNNCWSGAYPAMNLKSKIATCWPGGSFTGNQITVSQKWQGFLPWPDGNGTKDLHAGADMSKVNAALANRK